MEGSWGAYEFVRTILGDCEKDGDVDQSDFGMLQRRYRGSNRPADPSCMD